MPFLAQKNLPISNKDILSWIFDEPQYDVDKPVYIDAINPSRSLSATQSRTIIRKLIAGLRAAGLGRGDCVCVHSFNDINYPMLFLAIVGMGGIFTGCNPSYTKFELSHHLRTSKASFIIAEPELLNTIKAAATECKIADANIRIFDVRGQTVPQGYQSWTELLNHGEDDWVRFESKEISSITAAARLFSSGTTGLPKAAVVSHYNLVAQHTLAVEPQPSLYEPSRLLYMPMFHASVVPLCHTSALRSGTRSYILRRFDLEEFLSSVQRYKITELALFPPIVLTLLASPLTKKYDLTSVVSAKAGAAALSKEPQTEFKKLISKDGAFNQVWGMTETSCVASCFWYPESDSTGSIGRFVANMDVKIVDENDNDITALGAKGELLIRGPTVISQYFENPAANAVSFDAEGYFRTGDIVICEGGPGVTQATAKWYIVDRIKELIKVRAFQVSPSEIEAVILQHPAIIHAAVIGIPAVDPRDGESPRAYVIRQGEVTEDEVKQWCAQRLAKYKTLTGGVKFVDALPQNASGKILKRVLREQVQQELKGGSSKTHL